MGGGGRGCSDVQIFSHEYLIWFLSSSHTSLLLFQVVELTRWMWPWGLDVGRWTLNSCCCVLLGERRKAKEACEESGLSVTVGGRWIQRNILLDKERKRERTESMSMTDLPDGLEQQLRLGRMYIERKGKVSRHKKSRTRKTLNESKDTRKRWLHGHLWTIAYLMNEIRDQEQSKTCLHWPSTWRCPSAKIPSPTSCLAIFSKSRKMKLPSFGTSCLWRNDSHLKGTFLWFWI